MPYVDFAGVGAPRLTRALEINTDKSLLAQFTVDNGLLRERMCLGNHAIVKVYADSTATLQAIAALAGTERLPKDRLDDTLADLTAAQKQALQDRILALGYTQAEIDAALGADIGTHTLRDVVQFIISKWRRGGFTVDPVTRAITETGLVEQTADPAQEINTLDATV
jgi:hypothetical protein